MVTVQCLVAPELKLLVEALWHLALSEILKRNSATIAAICAMNGADGRSLIWENVICAFSVKQTFLLPILCLTQTLILTSPSRNP